MAQLSTIAYGGWQTCYQLSNAQIDLVITGEVGFRVLRFGFRNQANEFFENPAMLGKTGGDTWLSYGGHRLWHAPEARPRTYYPDNDAVRIEDHGEFVRVIQATENTTGIQKELDLYLIGDSAQVKVVHRLINHNLWTIELAPWAISVMAAGGVGIIPHPPYGSHGENLLPNRNVVLWAYSDMTDPRFTWGKYAILLRQDVNTTNPQKVGMDVKAGWVAYARQNHLFLKTFQAVTGANYTDLGASVEIFTNEKMLEVETLAPLTQLAPQASVEHLENWFLVDHIPTPQTDADVLNHIFPQAEIAHQQSVWG